MCIRKIRLRRPLAHCLSLRRFLLQQGLAAVGAYFSARIDNQSEAIRAGRGYLLLFSGRTFVLLFGDYRGAGCSQSLLGLSAGPSGLLRDNCSSLRNPCEWLGSGCTVERMAAFGTCLRLGRNAGTAGGAPNELQRVPGQWDCLVLRLTGGGPGDVCVVPWCAGRWDRGGGLSALRAENRLGRDWCATMRACALSHSDAGCGGSLRTERLFVASLAAKRFCLTHNEVATLGAEHCFFRYSSPALGASVCSGGHEGWSWLGLLTRLRSRRGGGLIGLDKNCGNLQPTMFVFG